MLSCNLSQFRWIFQLVTVISQCRKISYSGDTKDVGGSGLAGCSLLSQAALILVNDCHPQYVCVHIKCVVMCT
jgi:hypothetical protein